MYRYIVSSFIGFVMIASFMLIWTPRAESGGAVIDECVICACAGKFTGYMRNVPCDCFCECVPEAHVVCEPDRCSKYETPLVLQPWLGGDGCAIGCECE
jgi:hypothetical protein